MARGWEPRHLGSSSGRDAGGWGLGAEPRLRKWTRERSRLHISCLPKVIPVTCCRPRRWVLLYTSSMASLRQAAAGAGTAGAAGAGAASATGGAAAGGAGGGLSGAVSFLQLANDTAYKFFYEWVGAAVGLGVGIIRVGYEGGGNCRAAM